MARVAWFSLMLGVAGCGRAVTSEPVAGKAHAYEIECAAKAHCVARAAEVCSGRYRVVSEWTQPLALPDVPATDGMRSSSLVVPPPSVRHVDAWQPASGNTGPGDSSQPLLSGLEVVCVN